MAWSFLRNFEHVDLYYRAYRYRWKVEIPEINFLLATVKPGSCAVDIGESGNALASMLAASGRDRGGVWTDLHLKRLSS